MSGARPSDGVAAGTGDRPPDRHEVGDELADELAHDERLLWYGTPNVEGVRTLVTAAVGIMAVNVLFMLGFSVYAGFFGVVILAIVGVAFLFAFGLGWTLYRYVSAHEAAASSRRLVVTNDVPLLGGRESIAWDDVETVRVDKQVPLVDAGTVVASTGSLRDTLFGSGRVGIPLVADPQSVVRRLEAIHAEHATGEAGGDR